MLLAQGFLNQEEVDSGIIVSRGPELLFWHLTFQEYLAARTIGGLRDTVQQSLLLDRAQLYRPEWREVVLLPSRDMRGCLSQHSEYLTRITHQAPGFAQLALLNGLDDDQEHIVHSVV